MQDFLDERDEKILEAIRRNSGITYNKLYQECGSSQAFAKQTFANRVKKLLGLGIIKHHRVGKQKKGFWLSEDGNKYEAVQNSLKNIEKSFHLLTDIHTELVDNGLSPLKAAVSMVNALARLNKVFYVLVFDSASDFEKNVIESLLYQIYQIQRTMENLVMRFLEDHKLYGAKTVSWHVMLTDAVMLPVLTEYELRQIKDPVLRSDLRPKLNELKALLGQSIPRFDEVMSNLQRKVKLERR